jgi:hypothetical protein
MPTMVEKSISILSDAGLGMAMFSLGGCPRPLCPCLPVALHLVATQLILPRRARAHTSLACTRHGLS